MSKDTQPLRILVIAAHPDDCDMKFGGTAALYRRLGHTVKFVSVTNGSTGHFKIGGLELAKRRAEEASRSASILGIEYKVLDIQSNELIPSLPYRKQIIQLIREYHPDLIATHRPCDYHPDHRYTSQLVQDSAYTLTVPGVCPLTPHLAKDPVIVYCQDKFQRPYPFQPDVVIGIDDVIEKKMDMLNCHDSQFYEWLPFNAGYLSEVPLGEAERRKFLGERYRPKDAEVADRFRAKLIELYGKKAGKAIRYAEALEACEYGAPLTDENRRRLFPFLPR